MSDVLHLVGVFFSYAVLAIFAQNAVFTRIPAQRVQRPVLPYKKRASDPDRPY